ncbi:MAG: hypothetical protein R3F30_08155 [Planctomycetota bacterium]
MLALMLLVACGDDGATLAELEGRLAAAEGGARRVALRELARLAASDEAALERLVRTLEVPRLRYEASLLLSSLGDPAARLMIRHLDDTVLREPLLETLRLDEDRTLRVALGLLDDAALRSRAFAALGCLGEIGQKALVEVIAREGLTPGAVAVLAQLDARQRQHLAVVLDLRDDALVRAVVRALPQDRPPDVVATDLAVELIRSGAERRAGILLLAVQGKAIAPRLAVESLVPRSREAVLEVCRLLGPPVLTELRALVDGELAVLRAPARSLLDELGTLD